MTSQDIIAMLGLARHPEGGWFRETWRGQAGPDGRAVGTAIYFLLAEGEASHWHRVDATEIWLFHAGAPLALRVAPSAAGPVDVTTLGTDLAAGARPQAIVPAGAWQAARTAGAWSLMSCTVSPGFSFDGFELAPEGFDIPPSPAG